MARPKLPYCTHCATDLEAAKELLQASVAKYAESVSRVYTHEAAQELWPKGPSSICLHMLCAALLELGYVYVRQKDGNDPAYWVPRNTLKKNNGSFMQVPVDY